MPLGVWPPTLADVKTDAGIPDDQEDPPDSVIAARLASAVAYVRRKRPDLNYDNDPWACVPAPDADVWQGTVMLAVRVIDRRRSPDMMVSGGDLGVSRVASYDRDIQNLLGIGPEVEGEFF
jgi:hypothetical protein